MRIGTLSSLLAAAAIWSGAAMAQQTPAPQGSAPVLPPTPFTTNASSPQGQSSSWQDRTYAFAAGRDIRVAFRALDNKDFALAEEIFADVVQRDPKNPKANFYLGATRMGLGKWQDAKTNLELAAREMKRHPDPKSRLGVTYAKLGDAAAANVQRAELVKMADACNNTCKLSPYIASGIRMIDDALATTSEHG